MQTFEALLEKHMKVLEIRMGLPEGWKSLEENEEFPVSSIASSIKEMATYLAQAEFSTQQSLKLSLKRK